MVQGFAEPSGGEASIESATGKGTRVTLRLPEVALKRGGGCRQRSPAADANWRLMQLTMVGYPRNSSVARRSCFTRCHCCSISSSDKSDRDFPSEAADCSILLNLIENFSLA